MENKKKSTGWIVITILLLLIITGLVLFILKDNGIIKIGNSTKEVSKTETKVDDNKKKVEKEDDAIQIIKGKDMTNESKKEQTLGSISVKNKKYEIKYECSNEELSTCNIFIGEKKLENYSLDYVAVMDNSFVVAKIRGNGGSSNYNLFIYDSELEEITEPKYGLVDSFSQLDTNDENELVVSGKRNTENDIIDTNYMTVGECVPVEGQGKFHQNYVEKLLTFKNGKFSERKLTEVENVFCSAQR